MQITNPDTLIKFIEGFNAAETATERFAYAAGVREELVKYLDTVDNSILPLFQKALVHEMREKLPKK